MGKQQSSKLVKKTTTASRKMGSNKSGKPPVKTKEKLDNEAMQDTRSQSASKRRAESTDKADKSAEIFPPKRGRKSKSKSREVVTQGKESSRLPAPIIPSPADCRGRIE